MYTIGKRQTIKFSSIMFLKQLWPALSASLVVLILCVTPGQDLPKVGILNFDKGVHSLLFGGLAFLFAQGFYRQTAYEFLNRHYLITAFVLCTLYGGFLEILQATVCINRSGDWLDFLFDGIGAFAAIALFDPDRPVSRFRIQLAGVSNPRNRKERTR